MTGTDPKINQPTNQPTIHLEICQTHKKQSPEYKLYLLVGP